LPLSFDDRILALGAPILLRFNILVWKKARKFLRSHRRVNRLVLAASFTLGSRQVPLLMVRHPRARRYLLRLNPDGTARVTIPRGGNSAEALAFAERNRVWLENQVGRLQSSPSHKIRSQAGAEIWYRGELLRIEIVSPGLIGFGTEVLTVADVAEDLRPVIAKHLRQIATRELPVRVMEYAAQHRLTVRRVSVRNQKSRWGSCSRRGTISLNWRLIQTPEWVRDYIILHELAHLRQLNHSTKFWQEVETLCPEYQRAEQWLKDHREFFAESS
jgi:predicted metal-dependent hydrolase